MLEKSEIEQLFRQHYGTMYRLAMAILHDEEEARDVVSDVFARLIDSCELDKVNLSYLLISVRGQCFNHISRLQTKEKAERMISLETAGDTMQNDNADDRADKIWHFIDNELTDRTRNIVCQRYVDNKSCAEIATELGISRQVVHRHILRALRKMQLYFTGKYEEKH